MVDWNRKFRSEYDAARAALEECGGFGEDWAGVAAGLAQLMGQDGFDVGREAVLADLRRRLAQPGDGEDGALLRAVGADTRGSVPADARRRLACLKLLRHVYLESRAGSRRLWIVSLPRAFVDWPSRQIGRGGTALRPLLASRDEHFSAAQRGWLAAATRHGLAWCQRAGMVLAHAGAARGAAAREQARAMVRRWFAEDGLSDAVLDTVVGTLARGFKEIVAMLNRGHLVITDWVPFRAATNADESDFLSTEAFAFRARGEGLDVVYVEGAFFDDIAGNLLRGQANWTRILVHELSHLVCGTQDVHNGSSRYAWSGIGPHAGNPHGDTLRNADNWAFFAADCAGALTAGQRDAALRKV